MKYIVAGHRFKFILPASEKLKEAISRQYGPFEEWDGMNQAVGSDCDDGLIFTLELIREEFPDRGAAIRKCIYDVPVEDGETVVKIYRGDNDVLIETSFDHRRPICARILCSSDFRRARIYLCSSTLSDAVFAINNTAMLLYAFTTATLGTMEFHSSVVSCGDRAYMFLGHSGAGKSTHSRMWLQHISGSELVNDDNPIVRIFPDGKISVFGSPWSGKTPCYRNIRRELGAMVRINQWPENKIRKMDTIEAYTTVLGSISGFKSDIWDSMADEADNISSNRTNDILTEHIATMNDGLNDSIDKLLSAIPCYFLDCLPDEEAARICFHSIKH